MSEFLDGSVYLTTLGSEISRTDGEDQPRDPVRGCLLEGSPPHVYDLDTLVTRRRPRAVRGRGDTGRCR